VAEEIRDTEPTRLVVGTRVRFARSFDDWTPAEGTVDYAFQPRDGGTGGFTVSATDNGDDRFLVDLTTATTGGKSVGPWTWTARITASSEVYFLDAGELEFVANPFEGAIDERTFWEKARDDIRTAIESDDNSLVTSYSIDNRSLAKATRAELFDALNFCEDMIERERIERDLALGKTPSRRPTIRMEFD
jgi:hypothetical protein